jgi:hypothetical protein
MCTSKPKAPRPTALPPPPPPPANASPTAPVIDPAQKDMLLNRPKRRGLRDLRIDRTASMPAIGLNVAQG